MLSAALAEVAVAIAIAVSGGCRCAVVQVVGIRFVDVVVGVVVVALVCRRCIMRVLAFVVCVCGLLQQYRMIRIENRLGMS
jgi:hypothetical protein